MKFHLPLKSIKALNGMLLFIVFQIICSCQSGAENRGSTTHKEGVEDEAFYQETHEAFFIGENPKDNEVRDIALDHEGQVWIATAGGAFRKAPKSKEWIPVITGEDRGPAYAVEVDATGNVWIGTWDGLYQFKNNQISKQNDVKAPISVLSFAGNEAFALGPYGIWKLNNDSWESLDYGMARSVRDAVGDGKGNLWVATDVGLYHCQAEEAVLLQDTDELISSYAKAISFGPKEQIWVAAMGGVSVRDQKKLLHNLTPKEGIPSINVNSVAQSPEGIMWVGTDVGVVRYYEDGGHSLLFSRRWLTDDHVNKVVFDKVGNAWIATNNGVSLISKKPMTLKKKQAYFYSELMDKHIRDPWICGVLRLEEAGNISTWKNSDDDNDGEYTGGYLAMESFRYAVTKDKDALEKARKAFGFLKLLYEVTGTDGLFARTIVPTDWTKVHDPNRTYSAKEEAEQLVKEPRYKPVEERWRPSPDKKWLWKGDTSSDEMVGHFMSYFYFYEFAATEEDKQEIRAHVSKLLGAVMRNNYNLVDIDGSHTRWGVWSPEQLNGDPDWAPEKSLNSFEVLAFLKFAAHITGDEKFEREYKRLIEEEGYLENASKLNKKNPAWKIYFDLTLEGYLFPIFLKYEKDPELRKFYADLAEEWMGKQKEGENLINNLTYALATGNKVHVPQTISFLRETPLDLIDWKIDHTSREDIELVHAPIMEELQISALPAPAIRATVRWDKNPWAAVQGNPYQVREPVFWLWPYWMARYLEIIKE